MSDARLWLTFAVLFAGGWLIFLLSPILTPFLISAFLAYLGDPLVDALEEKRLSRSAAVAVVFLTLTTVFFLILLIILPILGSQIENLIQRIPDYIGWLRGHIAPWVHNLMVQMGQEGEEPVTQWMTVLQDNWKGVGGLAATIAKILSQSGLVIIAWLANLVLIPVVTFYLLRDWDILVERIRELLPRRVEPVVVTLARDSDAVLSSFFRGQLMVMLCLGTVYSVGLWIAGVDFSFLLGMMAGIVSFVPYMGFLFGILVTGVASVLQVQGIDLLPWVVLVFAFGQLLEGMILTPMLVGDRIGLHPVAVIFAVMAGGQLYGFFGVLVALPVAAVVMVWLRHFHEHHWSQYDRAP